MKHPIPVGILGATGAVGQKFISLLARHEWFSVAELAASDRSAGKRYIDRAHWLQSTPIPPAVEAMNIALAGSPLKSKILFSGLDSGVAFDVERYYAKQGCIVISNASSYRMDPSVPLIIPEINDGHLQLIDRQVDWPGAIITNSNCSTMFLAMVLAPLHKKFGVEAAHVTTMQAISGAGYPGTPALDIISNVIPYISGEEEKLENETRKILGTLVDNRVTPAPIAISAQCNRVPVYDGHTETLSIRFRPPAPSLEEIVEHLSGFRGYPQEAKLPSAPKNPIVVFRENSRPQPRRDVWKEQGMAAMVGRVRKCPVFDAKMVILGHNTIRGAAGAAILNAEMLFKKGLLDKYINRQ